jgi:hypothetical protein
LGGSVAYPAGLGIHDSVGATGLDDDIRWFSLFADVPAERLPAACAFWPQITGAAVGRPAGDAGEYLPLEPTDGDRYLWLQRVGRPMGGWHLDLHVPEVHAAANLAGHLGATLDRRVDDLAVLRTPAGLPFCFAAEEPDRQRRAPSPARGPAGRSLLDQLCFDIPADRYEEECDFWAALTGWPRRGRSADAPEFDRLSVPPRLPVQFLLQRLEPDDEEGIRAHADLSADDRDAEAAHHQGLGAELVRRTEHWTTLRDPAGLVYCVTGRATGVRLT